jgi:hypothetical protein
VNYVIIARIYKMRKFRADSTLLPPFRQRMLCNKEVTNSRAARENRQPCLAMRQYEVTLPQEPVPAQVVDRWLNEFPQAPL